MFQVSGKTIDFPGYLRAYVEGPDDPARRTGRPGNDRCPSRPRAKRSAAVDMIAKSHTTQPPARFSEASLTKALEELGIGRPSTYASIIDTIQARNYVFKKGEALVPTWVAFSVVKLLEDHLANLVDYKFTAQMEDDLDAISRGEREQIDYLREFLLRQRHAGPEEATGAQGRRDRRPRHQPDSHRHARGRRSRCTSAWGAIRRSSSRASGRASLPEDMPPDEVTLEAGAEAAWTRPQQADEPLGTAPRRASRCF